VRRGLGGKKRLTADDSRPLVGPAVVSWNGTGVAVAVAMEAARASSDEPANSGGFVSFGAFALAAATAVASPVQAASRMPRAIAVLCI
jgi:hypothetical protein